MLERVVKASHINYVPEIHPGMRKESGHNPDLIQDADRQVVIIQSNVIKLNHTGIIHTHLLSVSLT